MAKAVVIQRPQRWDNPFDPDVSDADVDRLLSMEPFCSMDEAKFPASAPLREVIRNDMRLLVFEKGEIIIREGDYGTSAFLVLSGQARVILPPGLPHALLGRLEIERKGVFAALRQLWSNDPLPEARVSASYEGQGGQDTQVLKTEEVRVVLPDLEKVLEQHKNVTLGPGQMFGEIAALTRSARTTTIIADQKTELVEIRRTGIRDIRRSNDEFRVRVDKLYRENSLLAHLRQTPEFKHLDDEKLATIADRILFETYGDFDWHISYKRLVQQGSSERLAGEPKIVSEGAYPDGLLMIRSGFARVSHRINNGEKTVRYIGAGAMFGFEEIAHNARPENEADPVVYQYSLRSVGYTDILRVPTTIIEELVLPSISAEFAPGPVERRHEDQPHKFERRKKGTKKLPDDVGIDSSIVENLVENRFINGTQTMLIDLDRCVRCDACVDACAKGHNNNPRFIRHGRKLDHFMVANACMHCADPVCMIGCPTGAIHRNEQTGNVVINDATCIGCGTCASTCPYDNIRMVEIRDERGNFILDKITGAPILKSTKCDLCIDQPGGPACQRACPHDALRRTDMAVIETLARWMQR